MGGARGLDAVDEPLLRLADDLLRAQEVTGIAPTEPPAPLYRQHVGPRRAVARRRLGDLGYPLDVDDRALFDRFRREAGLAMTGDGRLDAATWAAIEELVSLEADVDGARWRDAAGHWLPAMRRAILARRVALEFGDGALSFSAEAPRDEAPSDAEVDEALRSLAVDLGRPVDDGFIGLLFDHERIFAARVDLVGAEGLSFSGGEAPPIADVLRQAELARLGLDDATLAAILAEDDARAAHADAALSASPAPSSPTPAPREATIDDDLEGDEELQAMALGLDFEEDDELADAGAEAVDRTRYRGADEALARGSEAADDPDALLAEESDPDAVDPFNNRLGASADDEALSFGLADGLASVRTFFRDLIARPELRRRPSEAQLRAYATSITRLISADDDIGARWQEFIANESTCWEARGRSSAWLHGAARWLRDRGLGLLDGLGKLLACLRRAAGEALGYLRSLFTNLFRVLYHDLARVFDVAHAAATALVQHVRGAAVPAGAARIVLHRRANLAIVVRDGEASRDECEGLARTLRRDSERLVVAAELLGLILGITARWALGPLTSVMVLRGLGGRAQRILHLGRRLATLTDAAIAEREAAAV